MPGEGMVTGKATSGVRWFQLFYLTMFMIGFVAAKEDFNFESLGIELINDPRFGDNVYNCTRDIPIDDELLYALDAVNASGLVNKYQEGFYERVPFEAAMHDVDESEDALMKRCTPRGQVTSWKEWQKAQSGTWWSEWYPVSCCDWCDLVPHHGLQCTRSIGFSHTVTMSLSVGLSFGKIAATTSLTLTESKTFSTDFSCTWPGGFGPAQIWQQHQMYWVDMQYRTRIHSRNCNINLPWSEYQRSDVPIDRAALNGCSVGHSNTECSNHCGH